MSLLSSLIRRYQNQPMVRPWALATPVLVILFCLPLLRPIRHPDPGTISSDERNRQATIASIVERHTLALDPKFVPAGAVIRRSGSVYADQPPVFSLLLAAPYWVMHRQGMDLSEYSITAPFLLILLGATIPVAASAGLIYRMGRILELSRPRRAMLAAIVVFGSGLVSYGVSLNPHALAAFLVLASAGCLVHLAVSPAPQRGGLWLAVSGFCATLAAVVDSPATVFVPLLALVILAMRWRPGMRMAGFTMYAFGCVVPFVLHLSLTRPIISEVPAQMIRPPGGSAARRAAIAAAPATPDAELVGDTDPAVFPRRAPDVDDDDEFASPPSAWSAVAGAAARFFLAFFGSHGLLSHFPVVVFAFLGIAAVMHRHWPATTKMLAFAAVAGTLVVICLWVAGVYRPGMMYANRRFICFTPFLLFWSGAWIRRKHSPNIWWLAGILLTWSIVVTLIGATNPTPRSGYARYTPAAAIRHALTP